LKDFIKSKDKFYKNTSRLRNNKNLLLETINVMKLNCTNKENKIQELFQEMLNEL
jgi:hypothetical protein